MRSGDLLQRARAACIAPVALWLLATSSAAQAGKVAVLDLDAPKALRAEAGAISMLLRNHLPTRKRPGVSLAELVANFGGTRGPILAGDAPGPVMQKLGADRLVTGSMALKGTKITVTLHILGPDGHEFESIEETGSRGAINGIVTNLLRQCSDVVGDNIAERPRGSLGKLRPFIRATEALAGNDPQKAARALLSAQPNVVFDVPIVRDVAEMVWKNPAVPFDLRAAAVMVAGGATELRRLADRQLSKNRKDEAGLAAKAASYLAKGELRKVKRELEALRLSKAPLVLLLRAQYADRKNQPRPRDQAVRALLAIKPAYTPVLAWIARLPPAHLGDVAETQTLKVAAVIQRRYPGLATALGLRAARAHGGDKSMALDLVDVRELADKELATLARDVEELAAEAKPVGLRLRAEIRIRRGEEGALQDVELALKTNADDARLISLKESLAVATTTADATGITLGGDAVATGVATAAAPTAKASKMTLDLAAELAPFIRAFPALASGSAGRIAIAPLSGSGSAFYSLYDVNLNRLRSGVSYALQSPPYGHDVIDLSTTYSDPPVKTDLQRTAEANQVSGVILYRLTNDGSDAEIKLMYFDVATGSASEYTSTLPGSDLGLISWNAIFVGVLSLLLFMLVGYVGYVLLRGNGTIAIKVELDKTIARDVISVRLTRKQEPVDIGDPMSFADRSRRGGVKRRKLTADMIPRKHRFEKVPAGWWWITIYGTYEKGNETRQIAGKTSQRIKLKRNAVDHIAFDLTTDDAEYRLAIYDGDHPIRAQVWLDDDTDNKQSTNDAGRLLVLVSEGDHMLHIESGDTKVERSLHVADTAVHNLTINLVRERRRMEIAGGIDLGLPEADDAEPMQIQRTEPSHGDANAPVAAPVSAPVAAPANAPSGVPASLPAHAIATSATIGAAGAVSAPAGAAGTMPVAVAGSAPGTNGEADDEGEGALGLSFSFTTPVSHPASSSPGDMQSSRYRRDKELGRGAMGIVYRGFDTVLEREVALKVMGAEIKQYPDAVSMFKQEAKSLAALNHPNIVTVFDQGSDGGELLLVMEFVEGTTLEHILEHEKPLPPERAVELIEQLCKGLAYAHGKRVIHRDIKPANVFVTPDGTVKLGDFGLARVVNEVRIKQTMVRGTPLYMSPEQIHGTDIDFRADLYAVGCTLYEMVTGRPPFIEGEIMYHHLHTQPDPPSHHGPNIPAALDQVILSCIAKQVDDRIVSADALRTQLKRIRGQLGR